MPVTYWWGRDQDGEWTATDLIAHQALTILDASKCPCGCGGWADECADPDLQDVWEPRVGHHWRRAALDQGKEDMKDELKAPGAFLYVHDQRTEG